MLTSPARLCRPRRLAGPVHAAATAGLSIQEGEIPRETDCLLEGAGFEPSVPPRKRRPSREAPRPTIVVSRDDLCLMTPSSLSVRHLSSATAERPFTRAGPMVRIRFPPARSLRTIGSVRGFQTRIKPLFEDPRVDFVGEIGDSEKGAFLGDAAALLFPIDWPEPFGFALSRR